MIQKIVILALTIWVGVLLLQRYNFQHHHDYTPHFQAKTCFSFQTDPGHQPAGMVMYVEDNSYVVLWFKEADRRYAGPKEGGRIYIKWLDTYASHVKCPDGWVNHKGGKKS